MSENPSKKIRVVCVDDSCVWQDMHDAPIEDQTLHFDGDTWVCSPVKTGNDFWSDWLESLERVSVMEFCRSASPVRKRPGTNVFELSRRAEGED